MRLAYGTLLALVTIPFRADAGLVGVPSPGNSIVSACVRTTPAGDFTFEVTVRDFNNSPLFSSVVVLDFGGCPGAQFCPTCAHAYGYDPVLRRLFNVTDALGKTSFSICGGGICPGSIVNVYADGILLAERPLASTDPSGDLVVDPGDVAAIAAKVGMVHPSSDLDCDGDVDAVDVAIAEARLGQTCDFDTQQRSTGWGRLKLMYR
jgi:hypothetical protein